jgi:hypothetical protein
VHNSFSLAIFDPKSVLRVMDRASGHKLAAQSAVAHWLQIYGLQFFESLIMPWEFFQLILNCSRGVRNLDLYNHL